VPPTAFSDARWPSLGENQWPTLGENHWPSLGESMWPSVARKMTHQIAISMAEAGAAWQNGYAERLIRTIKEEAVDLTEYRDYQDAYDQIGHFLEDVYMRKRIHSSLGYLTPVEFEQRWVSSTSPAIVS